MSRNANALPLRQLADVLLRGPSTLTSGEREMIAAFVSAGNDASDLEIHDAVLIAAAFCMFNRSTKAHQESPLPSTTS